MVDDPKPVDLYLHDGFALNVGDAVGVAMGRPFAELQNGAGGAQWVVLPANRGAELHHGLVVIARRTDVEHRMGGGSEGFDWRIQL